MSDISHVNLTGKPIVISDVDDVVMKFIAPFEEFLSAKALKFIPRSFALVGNIVSAQDETPVDEAEIGSLLGMFFEAQVEWQTPFENAVNALQSLSLHADIVFLTAMPPQYTLQRRQLLDKHGLHFPMIVAEQAKGPIVRSLVRDFSTKTVFLDDMAHNINSVAQHLPDCLLIHMPPESAVHNHAPAPVEVAQKSKNWTDAQNLISTHIGYSRVGRKS